MDNMKKGDITEIETLLALMRLGYTVSIPYGNREKYDLTADIDGQLIRIQCKTSVSIDEGTAFYIDTRRGQRLNGKHNHTHYDESEVDYFATTFEGNCYLIPVNECYTKKHLRLQPFSVADRADVNWAENYKLEIMIKNIIEAKKNER